MDDKSEGTIRGGQQQEDSDAHRRLIDDYDMKPGCDVAFTQNCLLEPSCVMCFSSLASEDIDWATVAPDTPCHEVLGFLYGKDYCSSMNGDSKAEDHFCATFDGCVVWDEKNAEHYKNKNSTELDCAHLTDCNFPGYNPSFIGDGICHDALPGCYNSEACNYDGGDCCFDTCENKAGDYKTCGMDGYACRNPESEKCDSTLTSKCPNADGDKPKPKTCADNETLYKINMYDSFGDGWDQTKLTVTDKNTRLTSFSGELDNGYEGTDFMCLKNEPTCYEVQVRGGVWGKEVSWEIKPTREGSPMIAAGGAPFACDFPVAGSDCTNTCTGHANKDHNDDPDYKEFKEMAECIKDKCLVQVGACLTDSVCTMCFDADTPQFCFANPQFTAVLNCGLCQCREEMEDSDFCEKKVNPNVVPALSPVFVPDEPNEQRECTPRETVQGSGAVAAFSQCTDFDKVQIMVTDFDQDNFGMLDVFEKCAHSYQNDPRHGGYTALGCMRILYDSIKDPIAEKKNAPKEAISELAKTLYEDAESFCECAVTASDACPFCPGFTNFKTFLYESLDACQSLDEIDCAAWSEFYEPCKRNLESVYKVVDFSNPSQCEYVQDTCGGVGPFPAFRKLDCDKDPDVSVSAWKFYNDFSSYCHTDNGGGGKPSPPVSTPFPTESPVGPGATPQPSVEYIPDNDDDEFNDDNAINPRDSEEEESSKPKSSHFWRNMLIFSILGGVGYFAYKKRQDGFQFVRYRRAPQTGGMYTGVDMSSSTSFEPPTLPPPPSAMPQPYPQHQ